MQSTFGWERNHYDRIGHFAQGFIPAVLIREVLLRHEVVHGRGWLEWIVFAVSVSTVSVSSIAWRAISSSLAACRLSSTSAALLSISNSSNA